MAINNEECMREYICTREDDKGCNVNYHVIVGGLGSAQSLRNLNEEGVDRNDLYLKMAQAGQLHVIRQNGRGHNVDRESDEFTSIADKVLLGVGEGNVRRVVPCRSHEVALQYVRQ